MEIDKENSTQTQMLANTREADSQDFAHLEREIERALGGLPEQARSITDLPGYFWQRQRAAIRSRIAVQQASKQALKGFVWATVVGLCLLAAVIVKSRPTAIPLPQAQLLQVDTEEDDVMTAVEETVGRNVPAALAPAALLAEDISSAVEPSYRKDQNQKEKRNEN
jgi:flagellar biosynthesis/type III secretory pathway M-ring protein FliF/YscJ